MTNEQKRKLAEEARKMAIEIEEGRFAETPTNANGWCGCAAGILLKRAGMPDTTPMGEISANGDFLDCLVRDRLTFMTEDIQTCEDDLESLAPVYRDLADALEDSASEAP